VVLLRADPADVDFACVNPCSGLEAKSLGGFSDLLRRQDGALRVVLMSLGRAEDGEQPIPEEPVDAAAILHEDVHHGTQQSIDEFGRLFRMELGGHLNRVGHVREHGGDDAVFALQTCEQLLAQRLW